MSIDPVILERAEKWLNSSIDQESKNVIREMIKNNPDELVDSFYCDLEFGTGGLRGIMGVGTNRMNKYTVGMATQGLANYLKKVFPYDEEIRVAIAFDCRNNSDYFARIASEVLSANRIRVFLFEELRPTPELSFAVRYLKCHSGIVITASHNPKEYNGYKVYWNDGAQLVPPHDKNVIEEAQKITSFEQVNFLSDNQSISMIGELIDKAYLETMAQYTLAPEVIARNRELCIVYTPIHGTGITLLPKGLKQFGFNNIHIVESQSNPNGDFPTVKSPNPEEKAAMEIALHLAKDINAELILATDPDSDRIGVGVKDLRGEYVLLNGNQTAAILTYYLIKQWQEKGKLTGNEFIVKTIVTSDLIKDIAENAGVESYEVLTGFKWIAEVIRKLEGQKKFIGGGEESYGYMVGDFVRDKDAIVSSCIFAECAAWAADRGMSLYQLLIEIYHEYGLYKEKLINVVRKGMSGQEEIRKMMERFRNNPPRLIAGQKVSRILDYKERKETDIEAKHIKEISLPRSDVLQFILEDGSKISIRPSGTEPKIKFYFSIKSRLVNSQSYELEDERLELKLEEISQNIGIN